jgi:nitroreductase
MNMNIHQALLTRRSIRKYTDEPVSSESIERIMTAATWAPSGSNTQPWRFYVAHGKKRDELINGMVKASGPEAPSMEDYPNVTAEIEEVLANRLAENDPAGVRLLTLSKASGQFVRFGSIRFYQAPVAIVVTSPKKMAGSSGMSIGAAIQNLLLAAHGEGLGTCWLGMPIAYKGTLIDVLGIPEEEVCITSVSLGHPDLESPLNKMARSRMPYEDTVHILG